MRAPALILGVAAALSLTGISSAGGETLGAGARSTARLERVAPSNAHIAAFRPATPRMARHRNVVAVIHLGTQHTVSGSVVAPVHARTKDSWTTERLVWKAKGLPAGLSLDRATGTIAGTPTTACTCRVRVTAADSTGATGSAVFLWNVTNTVAVASPGDQTTRLGTTGASLSNSATDSSAFARLAWTATGLPAGLSIDAADGRIAGTPTSSCSCHVTLTATDGSGATGATTFAWTVTDSVDLESPDTQNVSPVASVSVTNPGARSSLSGTAITPLVAVAIDSSGTITRWTASGLPAGLSLDTATGRITGTPTTACACSVALTASDDTGATGRATFVWTVTNTVTVEAPGAQQGYTPKPESLQLSATDTSSTNSGLTWSATGLPDGLTIDPSTGRITGRPTTAEMATATVTATDGAGFQGRQTISFTIDLLLSATTPAAQTSAVGVAISPFQTPIVDNDPSDALAFSSSGLPAGLSINPATGAVTGTPTAPATATVTLTASSMDIATDSSVTFTWNVRPLFTTSAFLDQTTPSGDDVTLAAGTHFTNILGDTVTFSATGLPTGLSIDSATGAVSGTPTTTGSSTVTITATDTAVSGAAGRASQTLTWSVFQLIATTLPAIQILNQGDAIFPITPGSYFTDSLGHTLSYSVTVNGTTLSPGQPVLGLSLDGTTGVISGTPAPIGTVTIDITAQDALDPGAAGSLTGTFTVFIQPDLFEA